MTLCPLDHLQIVRTDRKVVEEDLGLVLISIPCYEVDKQPELLVFAFLGLCCGSRPELQDLLLGMVCS
jgi:hypothetical protein